MVPFAVAEFLEAADRLRQGRDLARAVGKGFRDDKRLGQEPFDPASPGDDLLVLFAQLLHAEDSDNVLQLTITLEDLLHATSHRVMLLTHILRIQYSAIGSEWIDGRVNAFLRNASLQINERIEMLEGIGRRRV